MHQSTLSEAFLVNFFFLVMMLVNTDGGRGDVDADHHVGDAVMMVMKTLGMAMLMMVMVVQLFRLQRLRLLLLLLVATAVAMLLLLLLLPPLIMRREGLYNDVMGMTLQSKTTTTLITVMLVMVVV